MSNIKEFSRAELITTIHRQQAEINSLRKRIEALEAGDIGQLRREVDDLNAWKTQAEEQISQLQVTAGMTQGLIFFIGSSLLALLGQKFAEWIDAIPAEFPEPDDSELEEKLGEFVNKFKNTILKIDNVSFAAWEKQRSVLEKRAATLPPLKRALFDALNSFAQPSRLGTHLLGILVQAMQDGELAELEGKVPLEALQAFGQMLDTVSNLWPLVAVNSLVPMLQYVGWDDAAEAAGEVLDCLERGDPIPKHLVHRVKTDLVAIGAVKEGTKPITIIDYLTDGYLLRQTGISPDRASQFGEIPNSATGLKRAEKAYRGLEAIFNRTSENGNNLPLTQLESVGDVWRVTAEEVRQRVTGLTVLSAEE